MHLETERATQRNWDGFETKTTGFICLFHTAQFFIQCQLHVVLVLSNCVLRVRGGNLKKHNEKKIYTKGRRSREKATWWSPPPHTHKIVLFFSADSCAEIYKGDIWGGEDMEMLLPMGMGMSHVRFVNSTPWNSVEDSPTAARFFYLQHNSQKELLFCILLFLKWNFYRYQRHFSLSEPQMHTDNI